MSKKLSAAEIIDSLKEMTVLEIDDVIKAIENEFGVTAAVAMQAAAPAAAEVSDEVSVYITDIGASKINVIKAFREVSGMGLMDAKNAVEKLPCLVKEAIKREEAAELKKKFEEVGAKVEVK